MRRTGNDAESGGDQTTFTTVDELAIKVGECVQSGRSLVAIAGAPGSGKSIISELLQAELECKQELNTQIVPMDGFHYDNAILHERDLFFRKGAPSTFDVAGLENILMRLRSPPLVDVVVPVFDRDNDLSRASARNIQCSSRVIIVEGNYLLLDADPWKSLNRYFDISVMIHAEEPILHKRLMDRWLSLDFSEYDARQKVDENDMPNAMTVMSQSVRSDLIYINDVL